MNNKTTAWNSHSVDTLGLHGRQQSPKEDEIEIIWSSHPAQFQENLEAAQYSHQNKFVRIPLEAI